jgi:hypothetical protein
MLCYAWMMGTMTVQQPHTHMALSRISATTRRPGFSGSHDSLTLAIPDGQIFSSMDSSRQSLVLLDVQAYAIWRC